MAVCFTVSLHDCLLVACSAGLLFVCVFVCCVFLFAGSLVDAFLNLARIDMTATVSSNAALGKKRGCVGLFHTALLTYGKSVWVLSSVFGGWVLVVCGFGFLGCCLILLYVRSG